MAIKLKKRVAKQNYIELCTMRLINPVTSLEFQNYYQLRWEVLRKPWDQAKGTEQDELETSCIHVMALNEVDECIGVGRLQFNSTEEAQIRYMGVRNDQQGKGVGKELMTYLENKTSENNRTKIILQARENAVPFYLSIGYSIKEKTFFLWNKIQHYKMEKVL